MRKFTAAFTFGLACSAGLIAPFSAAAQGRPAGISEDVGASLYALGEDICLKSLNGEFTAFDANDFAVALAETESDQAEFCGCVGKLYQEEGDRELLSDIRKEIIEDGSYFSLNFTMFDHMNTCLPAGAVVGLGIDLGLSEEDLSHDLLAGANKDELPQGQIDEGDLHMCSMALDDALMIPSFDVADVLARMKAGGKTRESLCNCAASYIGALGEAFQQEVENASNGNVIYASTLAGAIETCLKK